MLVEILQKYCEYVTEMLDLDDEIQSNENVSIGRIS